MEYPGAIYHVINRGNYRADIFLDSTTKAAFESCLFEACQKAGWELHAFVVMTNHYHLALSTPQGNLVIGMKWLQATFANRFNRYRDERGHLFQGRYKALLVEDDKLGLVCHYIHLNPVRAGILPVAELANYRESSYWHLWQRERPPLLRPATALEAAGRLPDTEEGWQSYAKYLAWQATDGPAGRNKAYESMSRGWALGSKEFKLDLLRDHDVAEETRAWDDIGVQEVRVARWQRALDAALAKIPLAKRKSEPKKSAPWKVAVAAWMKETTTASNPWLAEALQMGSPAGLSNLTGKLRRGTFPEAEAWFNQLKNEYPQPDPL